MEQVEQRNLESPPKTTASATLVSGDLVTISTLGPTETLPLIIQANTPDVDLGRWAKDNLAFLLEKLYVHGAFLFRGFSLRTVQEFEAVASTICPTLFGEYNDLPHEAGKVYGTTPYPPDKAILFHNESSHMHRWPMKQFFFCLQPSPEGGRTPIYDARAVLGMLEPETREAFATKGLKYVRNFSEGVDISWQTFFHTTDKAKVEEFCKAAGMEFKWKKWGDLRVSQNCKAVVKHPYTHEPLFFNQVQLHHVSCLEPALRTSLLKLFKEEDLPRNVYYGDGSKIPDEVMKEVDEVFWKAAKSFDWQPYDLVMVDNMLVSHARLPYKGPRKIVVAMGEIMHAKDLPD
jgi:alpha-ketoglutarate-dependent taurine dioxygenase